MAVDVYYDPENPLESSSLSNSVATTIIANCPISSLPRSAAAPVNSPLSIRLWISAICDLALLIDSRAVISDNPILPRPKILARFRKISERVYDAPLVSMVRSVSSKPAHTHLSRQPKAARQNGEKYGDQFGATHEGRLDEGRTCLQPPSTVVRQSYAVCVVCANPRTSRR